ncbi:hypothetical protein CUN44_06640 [Enterococcus faecium]|nr:hypothetical protein CUN44_06640 [Enterococcus faecium]PQG44193.1 hypothetical protein CUS36_11020 [Enterococcus faecium]RXW80456.1 hypothetical protein CYQ65_09215 [Enterococcus faecium]
MKIFLILVYHEQEQQLLYIVMNARKLLRLDSSEKMMSVVRLVEQILQRYIHGSKLDIGMKVYQDILKRVLNTVNLISKELLIKL